MIPFGQWLPDLGAIANPGATEAFNVSPVIDGYDEVRALTEQTTALDSRCKGAFSGKDKEKIAHNYAGTATKLYELADSAWIDRSNGTYALGEDDAWRMAKWGEKIIAVGGYNVSPQIITMGGVAFADLAGNPPNARCITTIRDFVFLANYSQTGEKYPDRVIWSGLNDETFWQTSAANLSDYQPIKGDGGEIMALRGGEYGVAIMENSIIRIDYTGPDTVFNFDETLPAMGTLCRHSVVQRGDRIYMLAQTGMEVIEQGRVNIPIGQNRVNRWLFEQLDLTHAEAVVGALDRSARRIVWIFPSKSASGGIPDSALVYDIDSNRFSHFGQSVEWINDALGAGTTLEGLDAINPSIDALQISLDSRVWIGGQPQLLGFSPAHRAGTFEGAPLEAIIETGEAQINPGRRTVVTRVSLQTERQASDAEITPGVRDSTNTPVAWGEPSAEARNGAFTMRASGKYHRVRARLPSGFQRANGITVERSRVGGPV